MNDIISTDRVTKVRVVLLVLIVRSYDIPCDVGYRLDLKNQNTGWKRFKMNSLCSRIPKFIPETRTAFSPSRRSVVSDGGLVILLKKQKRHFA